jgi:hypothetical protein
MPEYLIRTSDECRERAHRMLTRARSFAHRVGEEAAKRFPPRKARHVEDIALILTYAAATIVIVPFYAVSVVAYVAAIMQLTAADVLRQLICIYRRFCTGSSAPTKSQTNVPRTAEYLLYLFLSKDDREAIPGDLEEEFRRTILPKFGRLRAVIWYWKQTLWSIRAIVVLRLLRIGVIAWVVEYFSSRLASLVRLIWPPR